MQFHPEVAHTPRGREVISNFLFGICKAEPTWTAGAFIEEEIARIKKTVGKSRVICGLSGGVDSSVAAALVHRAIGDQLTCIFVDTGLLRLHERDQVERTFRANLGIKLITIDAEERFLTALAGVDDPEKKRTIIGHTFIDVFEDAAAKVGDNVDFLVQGTLYPDVIESFSPRGGPSVTIKTHHNVGGLKPGMKFKLIEPLRELFKDEVRNVGRELGLPEEMVARHPFPGPGLAIRILSDVTKQKLDLLRKADALYLDEIREAGLYDEIWQAFAVLLPVRSVGVLGDERTYENVLGLARGDEHRWNDRGLVSLPARRPGADLQSHHQSGAGHQSGGVRHQLETAGDHRVGVTVVTLCLPSVGLACPLQTPAEPTKPKPQLNNGCPRGQNRELYGRTIIDQLTEANASSLTGPAKTGLEQRIAAVDKRIADVDQQIAAVDAQVSKAAAVPGAVVPHVEIRNSNDIPDVLMGIFIVVVLLPLSIAFARRIWRKSVTVVSSLPADLMARIQRIEQTVESSGLEIERIGEGQRFVTKLLSERVPALPAKRD